MKQTESALDESISNWKGQIFGILPGLDTSDRPLCALFWTLSDHNRCSGCPVFEATGLKNCWGTFYARGIKHAAIPFAAHYYAFRHYLFLKSLKVTI